MAGTGRHVSDEEQTKEIAAVPPPPEALSARAARALEVLRRSVEPLRTRGGAGVPIDRALMIVGAVLVVVGLPLILLGWWGAARTPYTFEQIPYLISGGLFGLALAVLGGLFYFGYWMTRQVRETRRQADRTEEALKRIEEALVARAESNGKGSAAAGARLARSPARATGNGAYVATAKGTMFHLPDCIVVIGRTDLRNVRSSDPALDPCKICDPLATVG